MSLPVVAVFDIGKTNKKFFLFDSNFNKVYEESVMLPETADEDGYPCEDIDKLEGWIKNSFSNVSKNKSFDIQAVNFASYGASLVHLDDQNNKVYPLRNYLKPFDSKLLETFNAYYNQDNALLLETASPLLGNLNSALQLYSLKYIHKEVYSRIKVSLHLPQYLSFLFSGKHYSDLTSIGCHTLLWDFSKGKYHDWIIQESLNKKLAGILSHDNFFTLNRNESKAKIGIGLHDSSAAMIPYLYNFNESFILLSTGTWTITLNPFNSEPLTQADLKNDCLCYLTHQGKPVKASRLLLGLKHDQEIKKISEHFNKNDTYYKKVAFDVRYLRNISLYDPANELSVYHSFEEAYHSLIDYLVKLQITSTEFVLSTKEPTKRIFVDGGFSKNPIFMKMLAMAFPNTEVFAASMAQASALGAAISIHKKWSNKPIPTDLINLRYYSRELNS